jgi:hypothetical protein
VVAVEDQIIPEVAVVATVEVAVVATVEVAVVATVEVAVVEVVEMIEEVKEKITIRMVKIATVDVVDGNITKI